MRDELEPCPFCGNDDFIADLCEKVDGSTFIYCNKCGTYGPDAKKGETSVDAWNRRVEVSRMYNIVQISHLSEHFLAALYNDGRLWKYDVRFNTWEKLPEIPHDE